MENTINTLIQGVSDPGSRNALRKILTSIADRLSSTMLNSAGLVIKAGASALVKTGATACHAVVNGKLVSIAAATDMAALAGTVAADAFNVYVYFVDAAGTLTSAMGTAGATLYDVKFPPIPEKKAVIGFTIINPTGTGDFVGGTTAIDDATVVPTAVHVSVLGHFDPTILLG